MNYKKNSNERNLHLLHLIITMSLFFFIYCFSEIEQLLQTIECDDVSIYIKILSQNMLAYSVTKKLLKKVTERYNLFLGIIHA